VESKHVNRSLNLNVLIFEFRYSSLPLNFVADGGCLPFENKSPYSIVRETYVEKERKM
jgi:hypothetical protein